MKKARGSRLRNLGDVWEQWRMSHMFPELAAASTAKLFGELVEAVVFQEAQILTLEKKVRALASRKVKP